MIVGGLWLTSALGSLAACGGGGSESENWSVDDVDAGSRTSESKSSDNGGSDKAGSGAGGSKSAAKAGSGGSAMNAANGGTGGKAASAGKGGSGGTGGSKAGAGKAGSGGSKAGTGNKAGTGGNSGGANTSVFPAACDACAKADEICKTDERHACAKFGKDKAKAGPKAGALKSDLCNDLFACIVKSHCSLGPTVPIEPDALQPDECLCGSDDVACEAMPPVTDGPCAMEIFAASESTTVLDANAVIVDSAFASGGVFQEVQCRAARCAKSCGYCDAKDPSCVDLGGGGTSTGMDMDGGV